MKTSEQFSINVDERLLSDAECYLCNKKVEANTTAYKYNKSNSALSLCSCKECMLERIVKE